ncbi:Pkinase-domain-containing protein [Gonapodya prolifera JEL478]|uniref:Pkinase-domain-containing protein n=1 Tax=Gonapodya prolifera (strain JEL478) TaxID=1344416 RepID=A0A139A0F0_GONPJ|nr:Pkinase-domain-containing protein [Gonapodya prolifera JEL478]|eukprot:KXS10015.1 Pkinase-domain-containing protein [Gonapodya prolifera JEL478]
MNFFKNVFKNPKEKDSKSPTSPTGQMPRSPRELAQAAPTTPLAQKQSSKESEYVMGKTLGQGTYGVVRLCTHAPTNRKLACKVIQKKFLKKNKAEHMIQKEVAALRLVDHDNCISLVDFFETPATYCMVFELATGGELFDRIVEKGSFNERDAAVIVATITNAIAFLHDVGIVHRDLKPENLLFKNKDDNSPLTIVDFGISKVVDGPNLLTTVCGTPGYTAPEILQKVPYGKKVDIFSLGVVSYVLLCGYLPFGDSADIASLCDRVVKGDYEFDSPYWDHISQLGKDFVRDALLTDPDQRPDAHKLMKHPWLVKYTPPGYLQYLRDLNVEAHRRNNPNWIATPEYSDEIPETEAVTRRKTVQQSRKLHMTRKGQTTKKKSTVKGDESNLGVPSTAPAEGPKVEEEPAPRLSFEQNDEDDEALFAAAELLPDDHEDVANPFAMDRVSIRKVGLLGLSQQADLELLPIEADIRVLPNLLSERNQSVPREKVVNVAKTVGRTQVGCF